MDVTHCFTALENLFFPAAVVVVATDVVAVVVVATDVVAVAKFFKILLKFLLLLLFLLRFFDVYIIFFQRTKI